VKTSSWGKRATSRPVAAAAAVAGLALLAAASAGCARSAAAEVTPLGVSAPDGSGAVEFAYDSLDDRPVRSDTMRGQPAVIAFVDTGNLGAQAQVDFLVAMAGHDGDKVHYAIVALDGATNRELVEMYRKALKIPFPVAMADPSTASGGGPFGDVTAVPVTVVLDRRGRVVLRVAGRVTKADELRTVLRGL
jgi:hypothetical protein